MANLQNELAQVQHISGELHTNVHAKIGMVVGRFNSFVVESLVSGAIDTLLRHGIAGSNITVVRVPGAWEIPLAVARMA
ncbi:6,7-dimethyl-8-ribityllumazine synthase, partial [Salmonella enterica subsp. enterica serovar Enteritidis]|nr:6,7-dimethyl-8-ribityllumazine synthase [Salmonella enterica subsp. enterica serovar Enteritidis]